jgi:hypothetical protein
MWLAAVGVMLIAWPVAIQAADKDGKSAAAKTETKWAPAVKPKPLSDNVQRGLEWLVKHQLESGAWGQGEESVHMGGGGKMKDVQSVADTCIAATALLRSGSTPSQGPHEASLRAAVKFVCGEIEQSDADSLYITKTRGTRVQGKLGPYIDTFMACMLLSEVQEKMPNDEENERVSIALDKVLHKMHKNQKEDGTWDNRGWAATLSQSVAVKGLNRAAQAGKPVSEQVRERAEEYSRRQFDRKTKSFSDEGAAGVKLYGAASSLGALQESVNTNEQQEAELKKQAPDGTPAPPPSKEVQEKLERFKAAKEDLAAARKAVVEKLQDKRFVAGFGSNGGEEFLSYMSIGESLVVAGGEDWEKWDKAITDNLNRIQNKDGSWTGHHCITGRTFCTSAALLVLMVDRTPVPIAAKMKRR